MGVYERVTDFSRYGGKGLNYTGTFFSRYSLRPMSGTMRTEFSCLRNPRPLPYHLVIWTDKNFSGLGRFYRRLVQISHNECGF